MKKKKKMNTNMIVTLGLMIAMEIVLSRFLSISTWNIKIGFSFVPVVIAAVMYGPVAAGMVGAMGDFLGALLFPIGVYFPGFTATAFMVGVVYGLCLHKKQSQGRIAIAVIINQYVFSLMLNSLWISILYGSPYLPLLGTRIVQCLVIGPVQFVVISAMAGVIKLYISKQVTV